jgi:NADH-quinone oxidoreductase subunit J
LLPKQKTWRSVFSALAAFCGFALTMLQLYQHTFKKTDDQPIVPSVANIGNQMLGVEDNGFALPFEVVSMLLLAAMIGCIVIALRSKPAIN